ncbi:MAG: hypothetical protein GY853_09570 [PVC group bacterium]|nr:hypothetical protein [PVC group bacterium]
MKKYILLFLLSFSLFGQIAISNIPRATVVDSADVFVFDQASTDSTKSISYRDFVANINIQLDSSAYKSYVALITQSGINAPVVTVVGTNTIGSIVWTRLSAGVYEGTLAGAFTLNKTVCFDGGADENMRLRRQSDNVIELETPLTAVDGKLTNVSIEIRVYP